ncbi:MULTISPECIES: DnaJ domain-containing protein [Spirulina sp. CCY15215]|uniref:J domain-containing protein n=1 Tax=Spirulina sp. CCY15215 TaxID=2767591 RepID=UPI00194F5EBE|nr:DnaJ domain-containing protein [Spirulina major]
MNLVQCYRVLGLEFGAELEQIKGSYRRLARQYHPDVNPDNRGEAQAKFIEITEAYQLLLKTGKSLPRIISPPPPPIRPKTPIYQQPIKAKIPRPPLSARERSLKFEAYQLLQDLLKKRRFARAIAVVEGLAIRLPHDIEVRQWQAIAYQCWGRHLINQRQFDKARLYLKKALRTDPHNRSLWAEIEKEFRRLEKMV